MLITNSALQLDQPSKGSNVVDGTLTMLDGMLAASSTTIVVGSTNGSNGAFLIGGGNVSVSNLSVAVTRSATGSVGTVPGRY